MKRTLLACMACALMLNVCGQGFYGPSPDAMAMIRQASVSVNHYTGTPAVSIPLAEISGRELSLPVSLFYNSQGNKVQDIPSSEGLGWSLSAGGMITRIVRGIPDNLTNGYCTPNKSDTEPDLFIFSFLGRSGKFSLDANGFPVLYPYQDLVIKPGICRTPAQTWEIVDENGVRYQFGATSNAQESTSVRPDVGGTTTTYISTWYLSKIISPNGTDEISFSYSSGSITYVHYFYMKDDFCSPNTSLKNESQRYTVSTRNIDYITSSGGYIYFTWNWSREDIAGGKSLASIRVVNRQGEQIKKLRFEYGYFQAPGCGSSELCKRLRLDRIYDLSSAPLYEFVYNTAVNLPARNSKHFDHWGYFNNNTVDSWLPADTYVGLSGATREPDVVKMKANVLERINQRGGSYQRFNYEPHVAIKNGVQYTVSGVRVQSIETGDGKGNTYTKSYSYIKSGSAQTSGILFRLPYYSVYLTSGNVILVTRRFSHSYADLLDVNGIHVGYSRVEESMPGNGKVVYTFTNYDTNPDIVSSNQGFESPPFSSLTSLFWERGNPITLSTVTSQNHPVLDETFEYTFNHPNKRQISGSKTMRVDYQGCGYGSGWAAVTASYQVISRPFTLKKKTTSVYDQTDASKKITSVEEYGYDPVLYQLTSTTSWNQALPSEKYITENKYVTHADYNYDPSNRCYQEYIECLNYCGWDCNYCYENYNYCLNQPIYDPSVKAIQDLRAKHINNTVIEQLRWLDRSGSRTLLGASLRQFKMAGTNSTLVVPASAWSSMKVTGSYTSSYVDSYGWFVRPSSFVQTKSFDTYENTHAKLTRATERNGIVSDFTYLHDNTLVGSITSNPGTTQQVVSYTYKPLAGVTRETDPNGRSIQYEYDALSRPRITRDHEGNIRTRLRYHYSGETPGFVINASRLQANVNESINFSLADIFIPTGGTSHVSWNMGNGVVYNDNRQYVSISYSSAGTYTVSVTMTTSEYAPVTRSVQVTINHPLQINICVDGPQYIDVCYIQQPYYGSCTVNNNYPYSSTDLYANVVPGTGCSGPYSYYWEYKPSSSSYWYYYGSSQMVTFSGYYGQPTTYEFRCTVTDACGASAVTYTYIYYYESYYGCSGGGGPHFPMPMDMPHELKENESFTATAKQEPAKPVKVTRELPAGSVIRIDETPASLKE